jgi:hypothetical protein
MLKARDGTEAHYSSNYSVFGAWVDFSDRWGLGPGSWAGAIGASAASMRELDRAGAGGKGDRER